jgi:hypothetical protein
MVSFAVFNDQYLSPAVSHNSGYHSDINTVERFNTAAFEFPVEELTFVQFHGLRLRNADFATAKSFGPLDSVESGKSEHDAPVLKPKIFNFQIPRRGVRHDPRDVPELLEPFRKIRQKFGDQFALESASLYDPGYGNEFFHCKPGVPLILDQIELKPTPVLLAGDKQDAADRLHRPAFATNDAAHVMRSDANLDPDVLAVRLFVHLNRIGLADERLDDPFYSFFHRIVEFGELIEFIENKRLNKLKELNKLFSNCYFRRVILDQALDRLGRLSTDTDPVLDAFMIENDLSRIEHRIVGAYIFKILAVTLAAFFLNHQTIKGFTLRTHSH